MIDQFGQVMVYVKDPRVVADFWTAKVGFTEVKQDEMEGKVISVEISPNTTSDTHIVLFDCEFVKKFSPEINLGAPSILFSTYDIKAMHKNMKDSGVAVGDVMELQGMVTFNFPDPEGNYFAVREISK